MSLENENTEASSREPYEAPKVLELGSLRELTEAKPGVLHDVSIGASHA